MSVNIIAELHPLRSGRTKLTVSPKPIADIIAELNAGFPLSQARVCRNGEIVTDFSITAHDGDTLWIKFVPYGTPRDAGVGMKIGGWALTLVGAILYLTGYGAAFGVALVGAGIGMLAGGTVLLNTNFPSFKDREKPENDPSIRGGKNQARPHGRIPVLFGRHRLYPDIAANPHTEIIGDGQYFTQLFCGGYKDCVIDVESFKLGETALVDLSQTGDIAQILAGADSVVNMEILQNGEGSRLYPHCVHEDAINAPLQNQVDGGEGEKISGEVIRTTPDKTDAINVDIFLYNGIGKYDKKGDVGQWSVEVEASYKNADDPADPWHSLGFFNGESNALSGAELKTKRYQITKPNLPRGRYTVKIERITPDSTDSKIIDQVYVGSIRSIKSIDDDDNPVRPIRAERQEGLTIIALRVMATAKLNGVIDSFNYIATSKLPVYSGGGSGALYWLNSAETRNPASMLLHALRGRSAQQQVDDADIDWQSFEDFYEWCETHKYYCDAYLSESVTIAELLRMIGGTARADILRIDSKISVVQDIKRLSPMQLFTPKNTKGYSVTMFTADIPDAISLRYIDKDAGYVQSERAVYNTANFERGEEPKTEQKADLWGVTDSDQAVRIGMYNYAVLKNRPFIHTIEVDIEYLLCNKGDWIQYAGDLALTGAAQGRIVELMRSEGRCVGISADEPVEAEPGKQYAVRLRLSDGTVLLKDVSVIREPDEIYFTEPFAKNDEPAVGDIYAFGIRGQEVVDLVITDIQPQADLSATLTCVEYSPAIFAVDDPGFRLPEFENKITPISGAVDPGTVGQAKWKLFVAYHDAEREPPRPSGDGQDGGWHYAHTSSALWQSSKMAEAIDSGEWGPPVRIKAERGNTDTVAVYLALSPQTKILETDSNGDILAGLLPFTAKAELFKWNYKIPLIADMQLFPGSGMDIFDPSLGVLAPCPPEREIEFSLADAPQGVTIDSEGVITVAAGAKLEDEHSIAVMAEYQGEVYSSVFFVQVKKRAGENRYLGTIDTLPQDATATILKGPVLGRVRALQDNYILAVAGGTVGSRVWKAGYVYQWSGVAWEEREPQRYSDLYIRCFKDGLEVPSLTQDMGWFGNLFADMFFAQRAFIEALEAQVIKLNGAIYGGDKYLRNGEPNPEAAADAKGFWLGANGAAKLEGAEVSGHIVAKSGEFAGELKAARGTFAGALQAATGSFSGVLTAAGVSITGSHIAGTNYTICECNNTVSDMNTVDDYGLIPIRKTLVIAGKGVIRLTIRFQGRVEVDLNGVLEVRERRSVLGDFTHDITLNKNMNVIDMRGAGEPPGSGYSNHFSNTTFRAGCLDNPGIFAYMSSGSMVRDY